jgi:hypothetical protein
MVVNALSVLIFTTLISTGLLLKFVLPPGSGRLIGPGGPKRPILTSMGLTRHEWGTIHFYISTLFLVLLLTHLLLNWNWIRSVAWGTKSSRQSFGRRVLTICIALFIAGVLLLPWLTGTQMYPREELVIIRNP